jgi:hypothetical protein
MAKYKVGDIVYLVDERLNWNTHWFGKECVVTEVCDERPHREQEYGVQQVKETQRQGTIDESYMSTAETFEVDL